MDLKKSLEEAIAATGTGFGFGENKLREKLAQVARLFVCDCAERWLGEEIFSSLRSVVTMARKFADGEMSWEELNSARAEALEANRYRYCDNSKKSRVSMAIGCCAPITNPVFDCWGKTVLDLVVGVANPALDIAEQEGKECEWEWQDTHFTELIAAFWSMKKQLEEESQEQVRHCKTIFAVSYYEDPFSENEEFEPQNGFIVLTAVEWEKIRGCFQECTLEFDEEMEVYEEIPLLVDGNEVHGYYICTE